MLGVGPKRPHPLRFPLETKEREWKEAWIDCWSMTNWSIRTVRKKAESQHLWEAKKSSNRKLLTFKIFSYWFTILTKSYLNNQAPVTHLRDVSMNNWLTHGAADPYNDSVMSYVVWLLVFHPQIKQIFDYSHKNNWAVETKVNSPSWLPHSCFSAEYQSSTVTLQASVNHFCSVSVYLLHFQLIYAIMWEAVCNTVWQCVVCSRHPGDQKAC